VTFGPGKIRVSRRTIVIGRRSGAETFDPRGQIMDAKPTTDPTDARAAAVKRLQARRDFATHVVTYLVVNVGLVLIWFVTGHGYFWPGWVLGGWAIGVALHAWEVYGRRAISEEDIVHEMNRHRGGGG
jgi:hypothetical protein